MQIIPIRSHLNQKEQYYFIMLGIILDKHNCVINDVDFDNMIIDVSGDKYDSMMCSMEISACLAKNFAPPPDNMDYY